jgi:hypothetical protein
MSILDRKHLLITLALLGTAIAIVAAVALPEVGACISSI